MENLNICFYQHFGQHKGLGQLSLVSHSYIQDIKSCQFMSSPGAIFNLAASNVDVFVSEDQMILMSFVKIVSHFNLKTNHSSW